MCVCVCACLSSESSCYVSQLWRYNGEAGADPGLLKVLIVRKYSGAQMNCNRDIIPTYSANLHNKTGKKLMFL